MEIWKQYLDLTIKMISVKKIGRADGIVYIYPRKGEPKEQEFSAVFIQYLPR